MDAIVQVIEDWSYAKDQKKTVYSIFFDFAKAFDLVDHEVLLTKLQLHLPNWLTSWIAAYLSDRKQRVVVSGTKTDWKSVEAGVIQGSVLGPVLFLIFISDINEVLPQGVDLQKYADDILTYIIGRTITQDLPQQIVDSISKWCQTNKMRLNTNKCKVMIINKKVSSNLPSVELNNNTLEEVSSYKYLGVELTNTLCWDEQWHRVQKQTSSIPYLIKRLKQLGFREEILVGVYRSLGLSHFTYSAPILSSTSIKTKSEMAQLQNRIFKIIGISPELALTKYNIQTIEELIEKTCTKLLRRILADEIHPLSMKLSKSTRKSYYKTNKARTAAYSNRFVQ